MKNKLKKYNNGGKVGQWFMNQGRSLIDTPLSMIGMNNVIPDEAYQGAGSKFFKGYSNIMGGIGKAALPIAGQMIGIPAPITASVQQGLSGFNPQSEEQMSYAEGGMHQGAPNAEGEDGELVTSPTPPKVISGGQVNIASNNPYGTPDYLITGNNHSQGGVKMNVKEGSVFKGKLKNPLTGNLFKDDFKKISRQENKYTKNLEKDIYSKNTANIALPMLAHKKQVMEQYQQAILDNKEQARLLKKFKYGGTQLPEYFSGGTANSNPFGDVNFNTGNKLMFKSDGSGLINPLDLNTEKFNLKQNNFKSQPSSLVQNANQANKYSPTGIDYAMMASNLIGPAYNLATNKKPKPFSYVTPDYQKYDPTAELNEADRQNRIAQGLAKNFAAGNSAAYLATMPMLQANMMTNKQNVLNRAQNINTQYYNQLQPTIAQIKNQNIDAMQQDIARYRDINRAAVTNLGENVSGTLRGVKQGQQDVNSANLISSMFPDYNYDVKSNKWVHKQTGKILGA